MVTSGFYASWKLIFITLIAVYVILCAVYSYEKYWAEGKLQEALFTVILCVCFPIVGFSIVWIKDYYCEKRKKKDYSEIFQGDSFYRDDLQLLRPVDRGKEENRVSMEEALHLNEYEIRRKMVMETLREDTLEYISVLQGALENEDSETSHYASSIIMQLQTDFQRKLLEYEKFFDENPDDIDVAGLYEDTLYELLTKGIMGKVNMRRYYLQYNKVSEKILEREEPEEKFFLHRIQTWLSEKNFMEMEKLLDRYQALYPESEDVVWCRIQYCIAIRDHKKLKCFLNTLSNSPVRLTQKTLEYIRFFR